MEGESCVLVEVALGGYDVRPLWRAQLDGARLVVQSCDELGAAVPDAAAASVQTVEVAAVPPAALAAVWAAVDRHGAFELPSVADAPGTTDDAYHLGVSLLLRRGGRSFAHRGPAGPVVAVAPLNPTPAQMARFRALVRDVCRLLGDLSGASLPPWLWLKWRDRPSDDAVGPADM